ncbi:MAG: 3-phosphoserine/phosphohydroxythreonine transaminase [Bacteroidota bacterium]
MKKIHNFNAGPSCLPQPVLQKASESVVNFNDLNLSILEISHRSKDFDEVMEKAVALVKELFNVPDGYSVIFLQGGASTQFIMVPYNLLTKGGKSAYVNTGVWSKKAIKEAKLFGEVAVIASSEDKNFNYIPKGFDIPPDSDYLHLTSNNTIFGTQYKTFPESPVPVVCDMSSDIFSREIDVSKFGLIYAGAQKNMGPAGTTLVIIKDELLGKTGRDIPSMLNYNIHIDQGSMFNTPPVFAVYVSYLTLEWLKSLGGVKAIEEINNQKAGLLYNEIDSNPLFKGTAEKEDRSTMNVTFVLEDDSNAEDFNKMVADANINGLKGHRSVGGYRASIYNAVSLESVQVLVDVMKAFADKY